MARSALALLVAFGVSGCNSAESGSDAGPPDAAADFAAYDLAHQIGGDGGLGSILWSYPHGLQVGFGPAIDPKGNLYFQGQRASGTPLSMPTLVALDSRGHFLWGADTSPGSYPAPPVTLSADTVFAPATYGPGTPAAQVYRYDLLGSAKPPLAADGTIGQSAALTRAGLLVVAAGSLLAWNGATPAWSVPLLPGGVTGTNVAVGPSGTLYFAARGPDHNLYAVSPAGAVKWKVDGGAAFITPLAIDRQERIYTMNGNGLLAVYDQSGAVQWSFQTPGPGGGLVVDEAGVVYFGVLDPMNFISGLQLYAVRAGAGGQGQRVWNVSTGYEYEVTPALSQGGLLYIGNACVRFAALSAADGAEVWHYDPAVAPGLCAGGWSSATIGADGTVYASLNASPGGALYAFQGDGTPPASGPWPQEQRDLQHQGTLEP